MEKLWYFVIMNEPTPQPGDQDPPEPPAPGDAAEIGGALPFDPDATPQKLPNPREQFAEGIEDELRRMEAAIRGRRFAEALGCVESAAAMRQHANDALDPIDLVCLPALASLRTLAAAITLAENIEAVRKAVPLNLAEGWSLYSEIAHLSVPLELAADELPPLGEAARGFQQLLQRQRSAFYNELRTRRPATYGHPLLDPPRLRD